jgi:hypothetical protein
MTNTQNTPPEAVGFKQKAKEELKKALALTLYFGVWFCAIAFLAATVLEERPIPITIFGFALIKAALSAKFMLIAQAAYPIKVNKQHGIVKSLFNESLVYLVVVIALNYLEAGIHGLINGKDFLISMSAFGQSDPLRVLAISIVYWLIVWPYLIFMGVNLAIGNIATLEILFGSKK